MNAPIEYARSGDVNVAYQVTGDGPFDLVLVSGFVSHLENDWDYPSAAHFLERLGAFARLIRFDKRGTGLSDRAGGLPDFETRMDDVRAVMDAAGSAARTSACEFIRTRSRADPGLAAARARASHQRASESSALGAIRLRSASTPHSRSIASTYRARSSAVSHQG